MTALICGRDPRAEWIPPRSGSAPCRQSLGDEIHVQSQTYGHVFPQRGELAGLEHQHLVAGRKRIDDAASQAPVPEDGKIMTLPVVLKIGFRSSRSPSASSAKLGAAVIDGRPRDGAQNAVGNIAWSGNLKEVTSAGVGHRSY